jgi:hypothetical protein
MTSVFSAIGAEGVDTGAVSGITIVSKRSWEEDAGGLAKASLSAVVPNKGVCVTSGIRIVSRRKAGGTSLVARVSVDTSFISGITLASEPSAGNVPLATGTAESETCTSSEVLAATVDSEGFRDSAKTMDVEVGSRMPKEISSEFQRSFMRRFPGIAR